MNGNVTVDGIDFLVTEEFGEGLYNSCRDVKFGTMNTRALEFIGAGARNYRGNVLQTLISLQLRCMIPLLLFYFPIEVDYFKFSILLVETPIPNIQTSKKDLQSFRC